MKITVTSKGVFVKKVNVRVTDEVEGSQIGVEVTSGTREVAIQSALRAHEAAVKFAQGN